MAGAHTVALQPPNDPRNGGKVTPCANLLLPGMLVVPPTWFGASSSCSMDVE